MALRPLTKVDDVPLYADGYGFLLLNEDSVASLNQKLTSLQVEHKRFRPNIVVKGKTKTHLINSLRNLKSSAFPIVILVTH